MIRKVAALALLGLSLVFGYFYYVQYFKWRGCFNDLGRCYEADSGVVYLEQSGDAWLLLAGLAFGASVYHAWRLKKPSR
jgi:hypothetical protein